MTSWTTYNYRSDEISYKGYCYLLGTDKASRLYKVIRHNGSHEYTTYHLRG